VIVDTNALSAILDGQVEILPILHRASVMAIPVVVLGEYRFGIAQANRRTRNEQRLEEFLPLYQVVAVTEETSRFYADVRLELKRSGKPIPSNDLWIAALSRQHGMPILSRDRHFDAVPGVRRVSW
jgi:tRNA(fMet)-specific endonuclease VapC